MPLVVTNPDIDPDLLEAAMPELISPVEATVALSLPTVTVTNVDAPDELSAVEYAAGDNSSRRSSSSWSTSSEPGIRPETSHLDDYDQLEEDGSSGGGRGGGDEYGHPLERCSSNRVDGPEESYPDRVRIFSGSSSDGEGEGEEEDAGNGYAEEEQQHQRNHFPLILLRIPCAYGPLIGTVHFHPLFEWHLMAPPPRNLIKVLTAVENTEKLGIYKLCATPILSGDIGMNILGEPMCRVMEEIDIRLLNIYDEYHLGTIWDEKYNRNPGGLWRCEWMGAAVGSSILFYEYVDHIIQHNLAVAVFGLRNWDTTSRVFSYMPKTQSTGPGVPPVPRMFPLSLPMPILEGASTP